MGLLDIPLNETFKIFVCANELTYRDSWPKIQLRKGIRDRFLGGCIGEDGAVFLTAAACLECGWCRCSRSFREKIQTHFLDCFPIACLAVIEAPIKFCENQLIFDLHRLGVLKDSSHWAAAAIVVDEDVDARQIRYCCLLSGQSVAEA